MWSLYRCISMCRSKATPDKTKRHNCDRARRQPLTANESSMYIESQMEEIGQNSPFGDSSYILRNQLARGGIFTSKPTPLTAETHR